MGILHFGNVKKNRKGDHLRVAKPEGPPLQPPSWARLNLRYGNEMFSQGRKYSTLLEMKR